MAFTTAKMGLRVWNLITDLYDHSQLADNWAKVDYHDHSPGKGVQVPTEGIADSAITSVKLAAALDPSGAYLTYRNYLRGVGSAAFTTGSTYMFSHANVGTLAGVDSARSVVRIEPGDHAVSGRTAKMRLATTLLTNAVAPANTLTIALYPVLTFGGASGAAPTVATLGAAVTGSTGTFVTPAASASIYQATDDFDVPGAGWYVIGLTVNVAPAANAQQTVETTLQVRYV